MKLMKKSVWWAKVSTKVCGEPQNVFSLIPWGLNLSHLRIIEKANILTLSHLMCQGEISSKWLIPCHDILKFLA